jgi:hypothetical protein
MKEKMLVILMLENEMVNVLLSALAVLSDVPGVVDLRILRNLRT